MPRRHRTDKRRRSELSGAQWNELVFGPDCRRCRTQNCAGRVCTTFESPFHRRAAWFEHRRELLGVFGPALRPWGFWAFEANVLEHLSDLGEAKLLARAGALSEPEVAALHAIAAEAGGREWQRWTAVASILDLDPGPEPRLHDDEVDDAEAGDDR